MWDGNRPLHEWKAFDAKEASADELITWVFEEGNFAPIAKIKGEKRYSLVSDHLGTPIQGYNDDGELIWQREINSYGEAKMLRGDEGFCNYLYQGQTLDTETGLAYNRFRYYDPEQGNYISQDPIGLAGGNPTMYGYVADTNSWVDVFGLNGAQLYNITSHGNQPSPRSPYQSHHIVQDDWAREFKNYDPYIKELHEPQSLEYNRKWIRERMLEGYDIYDIGGDGRNSPFYAAEHDEIRKVKYDQHYGYDSKGKKKYKIKLKCKS